MITAVEYESLSAKYGISVTAFALVSGSSHIRTEVCAKVCMWYENNNIIIIIIIMKTRIGSNLINHVVSAKYSFASIDCGERYTTESVEINALSCEQEVRYLCDDRNL